MSKRKKEKNFETEFIKSAFNYDDNENVDKENKEIDLEKVDNNILEKEDDKKTKVSINKDELDSVIKADLKNNKKSSGKGFNVFINFFTIITMIVSLAYFIITILNDNSSVSLLINSSILSVFAIIYLVVCLTYKKKNKSVMVISTLLLCVYFSMNIYQSLSGNIVISNGGVIDLSGKSVVDAVEWANKNNLKITQEYEYSDLVPEFEIISQSVKHGTDLKDVDEIVISISEGPNPYKEVVVPSMLTWDSERVINFIKTNYLENVIVEFVESDQVKDTVIEQSKSGNLRRNDELKLVFSYGDLGTQEEVNLIDFTNKSKFEIEFFMKQHKLNYNFEEEFSDKVKKGFGLSQSVKAGEKVNINDKTIIVKISKGPKIVIPNFKGMTATEITDWAVKNRVKLEFIDKYDDSVKAGKVVSADKNKDDIIEQGTTIKVTLSLGNLKMPEFKDVDKFYTWADKYEIKYEVRHEFSDQVEAGKVISYSYKKGATIKNDEAIVVVISDGAKKEVPNIIGKTRKQAINELEDAGLKYNFVYRNSSKDKDRVIAQSISAGSEVSSGTTITVTLSNGKREEDNSSNQGSSNTETPKPSPSPSPSPKPSPVCEKVTVYIYDELLSINNPSGTCSKIKARYPSLKFNCNMVSDGGLANGMIANSGNIDGHEFTTCDTVTLNIVKND